MGDRIESGCDRQFDGEGQREVDVVENDLRQYSGRVLFRASSLDGLAEDRGRLGSGVGRGYHDLRQVGPKSNRLAEPGRRSASDRDETVGLDRVGIGNRAVRHFDGRMHRRVREGSRGAVRYLSLEGESRLGLAGRGEDERARPAIFFEDFAEPSKGPRSEDVASGVHHIIKGTHGGLLTSLLRDNRRKKRSEEHTSALQSLMRITYSVFCLKKKKT